MIERHTIHERIRDLMDENYKRHWDIRTCYEYDSPMQADYKSRRLLVNPLKIVDMTPDLFKNEVLKELTDIESYEKRGYHARSDVHWNVIADRIGVKEVSVSTREKRPRLTLEQKAIAIEL